MATAIGDEIFGDESCRDRPIYVRACRCARYNPRNCWYVIEEKPSGADSSPSSTITSESDDENNEGDREDILECRSECDTIRRLSVPDSPLRNNSLAVLGSHIYLIGGDFDTVLKDSDKEYIGYRHFDLRGNRPWDVTGGKLVHHQFGAAAVGPDGCIYSIGCNQYRLSLDTGILHQLPPLSFPNSENWEPDYAPFHSRFLALTKSKLFIYVTLDFDAPNLMLSYDLETGLWDHDYELFWGYWSAGVVLYGDRYLFTFGTQNPMSSHSPVQELVPGIYVFDIQERKWLPEPVRGLPNDEKVLPNVYKARHPDEYNSEPGYTPHLFQVRKKNDHKLALLWESQRQSQCLLHWSKFILNPVTVDLGATVDPYFYVSSLSNGFAALDEGTYRLLNCAAGMNTGPEKEARVIDTNKVW